MTAFQEGTQDTPFPLTFGNHHPLAAQLNQDSTTRRQARLAACCSCIGLTKECHKLPSSFYQDRAARALCPAPQGDYAGETPIERVCPCPHTRPGPPTHPRTPSAQSSGLTGGRGSRRGMATVLAAWRGARGRGATLVPVACTAPPTGPRKARLAPSLSRASSRRSRL